MYVLRKSASKPSQPENYCKCEQVNNLKALCGAHSFCRQAGDQPCKQPSKADLSRPSQPGKPSPARRGEAQVLKTECVSMPSKVWTLVAKSFSKVRRVRIELTTLGLRDLRATNCAIAAPVSCESSQEISRAGPKVVPPRM